MTLAAVSCTNKTSVSSGESLTQSTPLPGGSDSTVPFLVLSRVIKSQSSPSNLDFIGDGTGTLGSFCKTPEGQTTSNCQCEFSYTRQGGGKEAFEVPTVYTESNLIRCPYSGIPAGSTGVSGRIRATGPNVYSNYSTISIALGGSSLNLSQETSFKEVNRFQCRDYISIPHMFDANVYDPLQSEDTRYSYPLNFYTTNIGGSIIAMFNDSADASPTASGGASFQSQWTCSTDPNNSATWENLRIYSVEPDGNGSQRIYPPDGSAFDRYTFYLAKEPTGVFNVPVNAFIGPGLISTTPEANSEQSGAIVDSTSSPVGYAARPIPTAGGEVCPSSSTSIPDGWEWVKVWAWRTSLEPRWYVSGSQQIDEVGQISCNPGHYDESTNQGTGAVLSPGNAFHRGCGEAYASDGQAALDRNGIAADSAAPFVNPQNEPQPPASFDTGLNARILGGNTVGYCVIFPQTSDVAATAAYTGDGTADLDLDLGNQRAGQAHCDNAVLCNGQTDNAGFLSDFPNPGPFPPGADRWERFVAENPGNDPIPFNLGVAKFENSDGTAPATSPTSAKFDHQDQATPFDTVIFQENLDNEQSRFDFIFVVSPESLTRQVLENEQAGFGPYKPFTFKRKEDCNSDNPDGNPTCISNSDRKNNFELYTSEIFTESGLSEEPSNTSVVYPICTVRPVN